jgi:site-specific DNA recombinase
MNTAEPSAVAIYARASTKEQVMSCTDQILECKDKAKQLGLVVDEDLIFVDDGISGARNDREHYQRALSAAYAGEVGTLLLYKQSRLGRENLEVQQAMKRLEFRGVRIVTCDGYDTRQPKKVRKTLRSHAAQRDEQYLDDLAEDTHRGQKNQFLRGYWTGGRVYGYGFEEIVDRSRPDVHGRPKHIGTLLKIDPQQAAIVREIYTLYADVGLSCDAIAARLNERGVMSPGGSWKNRTIRRVDGKWLASTIDNILRQPCTSASTGGIAQCGRRIQTSAGRSAVIDRRVGTGR